jgi:hypothetical protein
MALHPEGRFKARIEDHGYSESKSGSIQFWAKFNTGDDKIITGYFSMAGGAAQYTLNKIRAMGYIGEDMNELAEGVAMINNECEVVVKHEKYMKDGVERVTAKIDWVDPKGGAGVKRLEANSNIAKFNALLAKTPKVSVEVTEEVFT